MQPVARLCIVATSIGESWTLNVVLSLDIGTTSIGLVALNTDSGVPLFSTSIANRATVSATAKGLHEQNAATILNATRLLLTQALDDLRKIRVDAGAIRGISVTGQMHGIVLVDGNNQPGSNLYTWRDQRSRKSSLIEKLHSNDDIARRCGCRLQPGYGFATLHQLLVDDTNLPAALSTGKLRVCGITDLVAASLSGEFVTDTSVAASWGGLDIRTHQWDDEVLDALGIPIRALPEISAPSRPYATILPEFAEEHGIDADALVCTGIGDHQATVLACRPIHAGTCVLNFGTGSQISMVQRDSKPNAGLEIRPFLPDYYLLTGAGLCGGWSYEYLARFFQSVVGEFAGIHISLNQVYKIMNVAGDSQSLGANGLAVDPLFLGSRTDDRTSGSILGIDSENLRPSNLILATVNGMVDELFGYLPRCEPNTSKLFLIGNAARQIPLLREVVRNRWGTFPNTIECKEEAALGAAYMAAVNLGLMDRSWLVDE